ncbi:ABC transporter ATP-binding protein [Acetobacteroides hydrogenigenes]|uniref:Iron complex transport system ATP-binding protein n=1 Tax=Acetobacteroides hydrogenigenes TaxID=979970 RepID=A0A4R2ENI3_9BACT|nr:ABC transporter ATP-binding protein [Acetobacteroides hydrogenigenes]TCN70055.1 iron complex transport system ATP-binding protein [Acetobacteroides hydrogenigenes]
MSARKQPQTEQVTLKATGLGIGYSAGRSQATLLHENLNLELKTGELTCLLGPNGAGKSTLIRTLVGFQPRLAGDVYIGGKPIKGYSQGEYAKLVSVVLTERSSIGGMTVRELVGMGRYPHTGYFGILRTKDHRVVERAIAQVGIADLAGKYVSELSDGERQKAMIAKALAQETPIIILDEPTAFLDLPSKIEVMVLLLNLAEQTQKSILLSTHDLELALQLADRLWLLAKDRELVSGVPEDLVLSGEFNSFFEREGILFDKETGSFRVHNPIAKSVHISGVGVEAQWVANALVRNGFAPSADPDAEYRVEVSEEYPGEYLVYRNSVKMFTANSIENLLKLLKAS